MVQRRSKKRCSSNRFCRKIWQRRIRKRGSSNRWCKKIWQRKNRKRAVVIDGVKREVTATVGAERERTVSACPCVHLFF